MQQGTASAGLAYDAANRRTSLTLPNGVVVGSSYDLASRLTGLTYTLGATPLGDLTYTYDAAGRRTQMGGGWGRTGVPSAVATASYNAANQQLALGSQTMTYDLNGNLATRTDGTDTTTYAWDARNHLVGLAGPGQTASFAYDGLGRRWTKTVNGTRTDILYDGLNPVQEGVLPGTPAANLLTGLAFDEVFTRTDTAGVRHILPDALGSTIALSDPSGAILTQYTYEPFGGTAVTGAASTNPFQYTGRENDGTSLYYYRARYYGPSLARFLSEDPIFRAAVSPYVYVDDGPLDDTDPLGLQARPRFGPPSSSHAGDNDLLGTGNAWYDFFRALPHLQSLTQEFQARLAEFAKKVECGRVDNVLVCYALDTQGIARLGTVIVSYVRPLVADPTRQYCFRATVVGTKGCKCPPSRFR